MKTFRTIIGTMLVTVLVGMIGLGIFLVNERIVTFEKKSVDHNAVLFIDGEVASENSWNETLGYSVKLNLNGEAYVGK